MIRLVLMLCGAMVLAGCQMTVVENLPEGAGVACPEEWPGAWIGIDEDGERSDAGAFVDEACVVTLVEVKRDELQEWKLKPRFAPGLALFEHSEVAHAVELDADDDQPSGGWWPFRWSRSGDRIVLHAPDHRRVATLIVNGALAGETHWTGRDSGWNALSGDAAAIRTVLADEPIFGRDSGIRMQRIGAKRRDLDREIQRVRKRKARE